MDAAQYLSRSAFHVEYMRIANFRAYVKSYDSHESLTKVVNANCAAFLWGVY